MGAGAVHGHSMANSLEYMQNDRRYRYLHNQPPVMNPRPVSAPMGRRNYRPESGNSASGII